MGLETATYIDGLVATNPTEGDNVGTANDHFWVVKGALKNSFPGITGAVTATHTELNHVDGVTSAIQTQLDAKVGTSVAGRWVQLGSTQTAAASAAIDFVNGSGGVVIDSTYSAYMIEIIAAKPATDGAILWMRTSTNAGSSYDTTGYVYQRIFAQTVASTTVLAAGSSGSGAAIIMTDDVGNGSQEEGFYGHVVMFAPSVAARLHVQWQGSYQDASDGSFVTVSGGGNQGAATDVDAIRFMFSTGNITSGTFRLYGRTK